MFGNLNDTIAAIGTPPGPGARGMVRLSGPEVVACVSASFVPENSEVQIALIRSAQVVVGRFRAERVPAEIPCDLFLWPTERSFTRQPVAELHTFGSPPLLEAVLQQVCAAGARVAEPGEFTLRAFLAGRLDLTQAEAVLGVIDAASQGELQTALGQLAGGLSTPLSALRERLVQLLASLEAGLDFVEEDIEFISPEEVAAELHLAAALVAQIRQQLEVRGAPQSTPRVALVGAANVGKSSLFNALVRRTAKSPARTPALVSAIAGTTRDYLTAEVTMGRHTVQLIDMAGTEELPDLFSVKRAAQEMATDQCQQVDLRVHCIDSSSPNAASQAQVLLERGPLCGIECVAMTKCDLVDDPLSEQAATASDVVFCSSIEEIGLDRLCQRIAEALDRQDSAETRVVASTAARCADSLLRVGRSLETALEVARRGEGDELVAAETRVALQELGRVVGVVYTDDVLDRIFSQFCIGK